MSDVQGAAPPAPAPSPAPVSSPEPISAPQPVTIVETPAKTMEDTMAEVYHKNHPPRSEDGKYEAKNSSEAKPDQPAADEKTVQAPTTAPAEPASPAIDAPQSWTAEMKAHWSKLSPETQEYVAKREAEATKRISELGTHAKSAEQLRHVIEKHRASLRGANEAEALDQLFAANAYLQQSPTAAIQWLANAYKVDLRQFAPSQPSPESHTPESEHFTRALAERDRQIAELTRAVSETRHHVLSEQQQRAQAQHATLQKLIDDFKADKPHWDNLEDDVHGQVIALRQSEPNLEPGKLLEKAYARALRVNEDVSKLVEIETRKAKEAEVAAEAKRKADEAKRLASINPRSSSGSNSRSSKPFYDDMYETGRRLMKL